MTDRFLIELLLIGMLILINGFFAGAEIAIVSARRARIQARASAGERNARALLELKADPDRFLATVQIGVTVVGTLASAVGGVSAIRRVEPLVASLPFAWAQAVAEPVAVAAVVGTIAYLSLVVGELVPKSLAVRHADAIALALARPILALRNWSRPVVSVLTASSRVFLRLLRQKNLVDRPFHTLDDLRMMVSEAEAQGIVHGDLVSGAVEFQDREVREVMTPHTRIVAIPLSATLDDAMRRIRESGHTRFPVYREGLDDVQGFVYARDVYEAALRGTPLDLASIARPAFIVPWNKRATALLSEMRAARVHMALVVDERGSTLGLVTMEDLLEVIVGEIHDEHKAPIESVRALPDGSVEADGGCSLRELNEQFGFQLPQSDEYLTVAGLVFDRLGAIPRGGEIVHVPPHRIHVLAMDGRRIARVRVERGESPVAAPEAAR
ncbi:MAG TPA: hemolysin family protein [Vicinamibacteria bacterium]|nr:hemolysin family protein [Vicinamibacteria bacterium]